MKPWTPAEDAILRKYANHGPKGIQRELAKRAGSKRSTAAIQRHASRLGESVRRYKAVECPECGREFPRLVTTYGLCRECTFRKTVEEQRRRMDSIAANVEDSRSERVEAIRKEGDRNRQAMRRRHL